MAPGKTPHPNEIDSFDDKVRNCINGDPEKTETYCQQEPIAIIGMGCRLPEGLDSPSKLWDLLIEGRSTQSSIPESRFNINGFYHPNIERPGSICTAGGYFLKDDIRAFDNDFFGINNLEATYMDPEQRKLLEVVFECFESAGTTLQKVSGANIGCYVGKFTYDYLTIQNKDPEYLHRYSATGMSTTILANRVSHVFNLQGPSLVLDTACSSSLYCLHMACTAINANECESAIVAGANLIQSPEQHIATMKAGVLSPTSTCHTFDAAADGYGRGESVSALYVKKLSIAIRDGDPIRSVIRGTAVNSNGKTPGITLPSAIQQEAVIRKAYARAGLTLDTDYVECHGTGTPVGDPIEIEGLSRVFERPPNRPLLVGSVKPNLGHSEAASAISSIMKVTLALENGVIPATFGITKVNPRIKADLWNIKVLTENTLWPDKSGGHVRRASVNSFGFGGANAHAVLEAAGSHVPFGYFGSSPSLALARTRLLLPFSASNHLSLESRVQHLSPMCQGGVSIIDLAHTLGTRRSTLSVKGYLLASQQTLRDDLRLENLRTVAGQHDHASQPLGFVFTGQGAQWPQMGRELLHEFPSFRHTIQKLDSVLQFLPHPPSWTIQETLLEPHNTSKINHAAYSQPVCTAIQIAIVQLLAEWGIRPEYVIGHSSGEICAAYTAGQLEAEEAILVAFYRGYVCSNATRQGAMLAVGTSQKGATAAIESLGLSDTVQVACINSPENVTISGDCDGVMQLRAHFQGLNIFARDLKTDGKAYHSYHMALVGQDYYDLVAAALPLTPNKVRNRLGPQWISTVTGEPITSNIDRNYWRVNLESPVLFSTAVQNLANHSGIHFIEIGPHPVLELPIKQVVSTLKVDRSKMVYSSTLSRGKSALDTMLNLMGDLYLHHHDVSFSSINRVDLPFSKSTNHVGQGKLLLNLPNYRWAYDRTLWNESQTSVGFRNRRYKRHDILGSRLEGTSDTVMVWRNILRAKDVPWLRDHRIDGLIVFPAAGYIAMAIEAACQLTSTNILSLPPCHLWNVTINKALVLSEEEHDNGVEVHTTLHQLLSSSTDTSEMSWQFSVTSSLDGKMTTHAAGRISIEHGRQQIREKLSMQSDDLETHSVRSWYDRLSQAGLNFSGPFRSLCEIQCPKNKNTRHTVATTYLQRGGGMHNQSVYALHPSTIDAILHTALIATAAGVLKDFQLRIPVAIQSLRIHIPPSYTGGELLTVHGAADPVGLDSMKTSVEVHSQQHGVFIQAEDCRLVVPFQGQQSIAQERHPMLKVSWKPDITRINANNAAEFSAYLKSIPPSILKRTDDASLQGCVAAIDLLSHKDPGLRIAEFGNDHAAVTENLLHFLQFNTTFKRCQSYAKCTLSGSEDILLEYATTSSPESYEFSRSISATERVLDVLIIFSSTWTENFLFHHLEQIRPLLSPKGVLLGQFSASQVSALRSVGFALTRLTETESSALVLARHRDTSHSNFPFSKDSNREIVLIEGNPTHLLNEVLVVKVLECIRQPINRIQFNKTSIETIKPGSIVISTLELEQPILPTISAEDLDLTKTLIDSAFHLLWITGGGLLRGSQPDFALASGLSRAVMLEQPAMKFLLLDIDDLTTRPEQTVSNILSVLDQGLRETTPDYEFVQDQGTLHVSRFVPEMTLNSTFRQKQGLETISMQLKDATPCQLSFQRPGQLDTAYFKKLDIDNDELESDVVEFAVKSIDLDAHSIDTLLGAIETSHGTMMLQICGTITRTGAEVTSLAPGDRVVSLAPRHFVTTARVPEWTCIKLQDGEKYNSGLPMLLAYSTAIYALQHCSQISAGDSVLILSGASDIGANAIRVARRTGAEVFSTRRTKEEEDFLVEELEMRRDHIFNSESPAFLEDILAVTEKQGFPMIFNSSTDNVPTAIWEACANFGCLVEVNQRHSGDVARLSLAIPSRTISFTTFCMDDIFYRRDHQTWAGLLKDSMALFREEGLGSITSRTTFDVAEITRAFHYLRSGTRTSTATISLETPESSIKVLPCKYDTVFSADKWYFLIGCLGGIGRGISQWMFTRGAKKFLYLGRSGLERKVAQDFVLDLQKKGAEVIVVQGDVSKFSDVESAVNQIDGVLGGVIQAAMGLNESLFTTMSHQQWHTAMAPKVLGTWNVHNAIKKKDSALDFFLMTSSISGSVGVATESNYCASNYFLDMFARYRLNAGLPATSIGLGMISQIGYLHEHPDIQNGLVQKGVSPIDADDFLQIIDTALSASFHNDTKRDYDRLCKGHILTGLEPLELNELRKKGFEGIPATFDDPRAALLNVAQGEGTSGQASAYASGLPAELVEAFQKGELVFETALSLIAKQFSNFLLTPVDKLDVMKPLAGFGMDSMLAAAVRAWFYRKFKVDLAFMTLLSQTLSIRDLAQTVIEQVTKRTDAEEV